MSLLSPLKFSIIQDEFLGRMNHFWLTQFLGKPVQFWLDFYHLIVKLLWIFIAVKETD